MKKLAINNLSYRAGRANILENIHLSVEPGEFVGIIGPNGAGKSTLLKTIYKIIKPDSGRIEIDGRNLNRLNRKELACMMAVVAQETPAEFDFPILDIIRMGRYPYKKIFESDTRNDRKIVCNALAKVGLTGYEHRQFLTLSGGEKQRVLIARALAQTADLLILDEPTNHLDPGATLQIMNIVKDLDITVLSAIHDLNIAALYCDRIVVMKNGCIVKQGTPEDIFNSRFIRHIFNAEVSIQTNPVTGKPQSFFIPGYVEKSSAREGLLM